MPAGVQPRRFFLAHDVLESPAQQGSVVMVANILAWTFLGLIAGFLAAKVVNRSGSGILLDIVLGIIGAVIGGWVFHALGAAGVTGFNLWSILVAFVGAVLLLLVWHRIHGPKSRGNRTGVLTPHL